MRAQIVEKFIHWIFQSMISFLNYLAISLSTRKKLPEAIKIKTKHGFREISEIYIKHLDWSQIDKKTKLQLYANYKQATCGDNTDKRPKGSFWSRKLVQWSAWKRLKGTNPKDAENQYVNLYLIETGKQVKSQRKPFLTDIVKIPDKNISVHKKFPQYFDKSFSAVPPNHLTTSMIDDYIQTHVQKYKSIVKGKTLTDLKSEELPRPIGDGEFYESLVNTLYARAIVPLSSIYKRLFKLDKNDLGASKYFICDTTIVRGFQVDKTDGFWIAPTIVLLNDSRVIAIAAENICHNSQFPPDPFPSVIENLTVVFPGDKLAWEMAKLHTFANLAAISTIGFHPLEHFILMDPIAISNTIIAEKFNLSNSIFSKIITEHTYLQIQVNSNVLFSAHSVINNDKMPYYPWTTKSSTQFGILNIFRLIAEGWDGHPIYQGEPDLFHFTPIPIGGYGRLLTRAQKIVEEFVDTWFGYFERNPNEIEFTVQFLKELSTRLPPICFLNPLLKKVCENMSDSMALMKQILIYIIFTPIEHSVDHQFLQRSFFRETCHQIIRKPIPFQDKSTDPIYIQNYIKNINTLDDRAKHTFCQYFSFHHYPSKTLNDLFFSDGGYWVGLDPDKHDIDMLTMIQENYLRKLSTLFETKDSPISWLNLGTSIQS